MQGLRSHPSEVECKDKFLIQSTIVDSGTKEEDITVDLVSIVSFTQIFIIIALIFVFGSSPKAVVSMLKRRSSGLF